MLARVTANTAHVVHETIDGEAILIHLGTGTYYSLDGIAAELWGLLSAGTDRDALVSAAQDRYDGDPAEIEDAVTGLLQELLGEELLIESDSPTTSGVRLPTGRIPFAVPVLHVYTDMQEFMLVDPLHDVDERAGWPQAETPAASDDQRNIETMM